MKHLDGFEKLGLSIRDSRVYVALLKSGLSSIRAISDITKLNRGTVYESLKNLSTAGLVSFQQKNVNKKYFAEDPSKLLKLIENKKDELVELEKKTKSVMPALLTTATYLPYANIKFYEDHEGVAVILRDVLDTVGGQTKREYCAVSSKEMRQYLYKKFPSFTRQRIKNGIFVKVVAVGPGGDEAPNSQRKWLKVGSSSQPSSYTLIYGNKFAIIGLNDSYNPYGIVIDDTNVAEMQRVLFNQLWKSI